MTGQNLGTYELLAKYWKLDTQEKTLFYHQIAEKNNLWILVRLCDMTLFLFNVWNPIQQWYDTWGNNKWMFFLFSR